MEKQRAALPGLLGIGKGIAVDPGGRGAVVLANCCCGTDLRRWEKGRKALVKGEDLPTRRLLCRVPPGRCSNERKRDG